jgi:hypothetical protein
MDATVEAPLPANPKDSVRRKPRRRRIMLIFCLLFLLPLLARAALIPFDDRPMRWSQADWSSIGALPPAAQSKPARVLVLAGRTGGLKGALALHTWIVLKPENARAYRRYDVVGWGSPVRVNGWAPDGRWFGDRPVVIADIEGPDAVALIPKMEAAIKDYQFRNDGDYRLWPGPNSNTFVAAVLRAVPEIGATTAPNAIGRDFRDGFYAGLTDSRTGVEVNLYGLLGFKLGWVEGIEINVLSLVAGLDIRHPALKLPGFGRIGVPEWLGGSATVFQPRS